MMRWHLKRSTARPRPIPATVPGEEALAETLSQVDGAPLPTRWESAGEFTDTVRMMQETRLHLEVDEGVSVPVILGDQNAGLVVEATQRLREIRERERASVPPVADFGGDSGWSGAGDW